jgi:hypothetical protein
MWWIGSVKEIDGAKAEAACQNKAAPQFLDIGGIGWLPEPAKS